MLQKLPSAAVLIGPLRVRVPLTICSRHHCLTPSLLIVHVLKMLLNHTLFFLKVAVNDISVMSGLLPVGGERKEERDRLKGHNPPPKFASSEAKGYVH